MHCMGYRTANKSYCRCGHLINDMQLRVALANDDLVVKDLGDAESRKVQQPLPIRRTFKPIVAVALLATPPVRATSVINVEVHHISHLVAVVAKAVRNATSHCDCSFRASWAVE